MTKDVFWEWRGFRVTEPRKHDECGKVALSRLRSTRWRLRCEQRVSDVPAIPDDALSILYNKWILHRQNIQSSMYC